MTSRVPTSCDDPRHVGYPCFGQRKEGKVKSNQHASWASCVKCGLRTQYVSKKGMHGNDRAMGPEPSIIRFAMKELEAATPADQVNADMVNGKILEVKGKMLQAGIKTSMAVNMTYREYVARINSKGRQDGYMADGLEPPPSAVQSLGKVTSTATSSEPQIPMPLQQTLEVIDPATRKTRKSQSPIRTKSAAKKEKENPLDGSFVVIHTDTEDGVIQVDN